MKLELTLFLVGCACVFTGCGTAATRTGAKSEFSNKFPPVYPATYVDAGFISAPCRSGFTGSAAKKTGACIMGLIDLPISLATDTLILPYDIYKVISTEGDSAEPSA